MVQPIDSRNTPYFSIIIPVYGVEEYLEQCIESVLNQDFFDYELILVDDGSPDRCPQICDTYAQKYGHVSVIHKTNGGLSSARNTGTAAAHGTYIWWVDADDWICQGALSVLYDTSRVHTPDIVKFNHFRLRQTAQPVRSNAHPGFCDGAGECRVLLKQAFLTPGEYCLSAWGHIYKREFLQKHQLSFVSEREIGSEDYLFTLQTLVCAQKIRIIEQPLYFYRKRAGSLTQRYRNNLLEQYTNLYLRLSTYYRQLEADSYTGRICRFYVWHLIHGTCIGNEYRVTADHTMADGRRRLAAFLVSPDFRNAALHCDCTGLSLKQRIQVFGMLIGAEPLLYWLYVVKPKRKKGRNHED